MEAIKTTLKSTLEEAARHLEAELAAAAVARFAFNTLPHDDMATIECCWHSKKFFGCDENRAVHYNELIASWILEGYFDSALLKHSVENAYAAGYRAFEALLARGLLKAHDGEDFVAMESLALAVPDDRIKGFDERSSLGLPAVFAGDSDQWKGLGTIAAAEGVMRSTETKMIKTLFIDGERLGQEVLETFFSAEVKESLETLVVTKPRLKNLDFLAGARNLRILVLRDCGDVLKNINTVSELGSLTVLEVSGATRLGKFPDGLFEKPNRIQSLNLAGSRVEWLPFTWFEKLTQLRWLVLRDCLELAELPSLRGFENLEVLDVSGVSSLKKFKNKNFGELKKLRALDFSEAQSAPLPFVDRLKSLTRLTLNGCAELTRLPKMPGLTGLRVLEVTGAKKLKEFYGPCLEKKPALEILDLSRSSLTRLPSSFSHLPKLEHLNLSNMVSLEDFKDISFSEFKSLKSLNISETNVKTIPKLSKLENLRTILLRGCRKLESLPAMEGLTSLEEIDLSGAAELREIPEQATNLPALRRLFLGECKKLEKIATLTSRALKVLNLSGCEALVAAEIEKQPFGDMAELSDLNLSRTKTQSLTSLRCPVSLRKLSLQNCIELKEISAPESLSRLEELNLSGAKSIQNGEAKKFESATQLRILDLSETSMHVSPGDIAKCTELRELSLRGCVFSEAKIEMQSLTNMEVLDLSEISVGSERKSLRLDDIDGIGNLSRLRTLRLWGCEATSFPYWISGLTGLQSLQLPDLETVKTLDWALIKRLPNDLNWEECKILAIAIDGDNKTPSISLTGAKIFEALKKNPNKWGESFKRFCIYVCPIAGSEEDDDVYRMRDEKRFEDLYMDAIRCPESRRERFLEIRGFERLPEELGQDVLDRIDCLSLVDDRFVKSLSDLGAESFDAIIGLWLDRCANMETVFSLEKAVKLGSGFRILWASNLASLKSLGFRHDREESFKSLTELYLDCCPVIEYIFEGSSVPENLERLEVMFCVKLKGLVECKPSSSSSLPDLPRLQELCLVELPELSSFGVNFRGLRTAKIDGCPKLEKQSFVDSIGRGVEINCIEESWDGIVTEELTVFNSSLNSNN